MGWLKLKGCLCPNCGADPCEDLPALSLFDNVTLNCSVGRPLSLDYGFLGYYVTMSPAATSYTHGTAPPGLSMDVRNQWISGTPTTEGTYYMTIATTNACGTYTGVITFVITACRAPTVVSASSSGTVGTAWSYTISATGHGYGTLTYLTGTRPSWMSVNSSTGALTGTPTAPFSGNILLAAVDSCGFGYGSLALSITNQGGPPCPCIFAGTYSTPESAGHVCVNDSFDVTNQFPCARLVTIIWNITGSDTTWEINVSGSVGSLFGADYPNQSNPGSGTFIVPAGETVLGVTAACNNTGDPVGGYIVIGC